MKTQKIRKIRKKTDYKARLGMLKSEIPRIVVRKTNKYLIVQLVESKEAKDKVILGITSKQLLKQGWDEKNSGSLKSIPAAYLTGKLFGIKIKDKGKVILDLGLQRNVKGSRLFAVLKGIVDAGVEIDYDKKIFPSQERIEGKHMKEEIQKIFEKINKEIK